MFENVKNHNSLIEFYRENGLEVSNDIETEDGAVVSLALTEKGKVISAATLSYRFGVFILDYIAVDINLRQDGLGSKILKSILQEARQKGTEKVYITAKNTEFFKSQGFRKGSPEGVDMNIDCLGCPLYNNGCAKLPMVINL